MSDPGWDRPPGLARPDATALGAAVARARRLAQRVVGRLAGPLPAPDPRSALGHLAALDTPRLVRAPAIRAVSSSGDGPRLTVLLPALQVARLTGGPNTAINLAARLVDRGIRVRLVSAVEPADALLGPMRAHIDALAGRPVAGRIELDDATGPEGLALAPEDVLMATWWPTAHTARAGLAATGAREFLYLIQDYEPGFYAWSTNYALAEATYGFPHRAIYNERLLGEYVGRLGGGPGSVSGQADGSIRLPGPDPVPGSAMDRAIAFEPAVDRGLFHPPAAGERGVRHRLLFYARPHQERNAFELGLRALRMAAARGAFRSGVWEAHSIGGELPDLALGDGLTMVNVPWRGLDAYAACLRESALLLSLMVSPHTSYPPLEMAACGGRVVTNTFAVKTAAILAGISPRIVGVAPEPEALADALGRAAALVDVGDASGAPGDVASDVSALSLPATWDEAFAEVVPWLAETVRELSGRA